MFSGVVTSSDVTLRDGATLSNASITATGETASVVGDGSFGLNDVRINSREGVRIGGSGNITINNSYIETTGLAGDHADGIQAYDPGGTGNVTITNTAIVSHDGNATAGMFVADSYSGTFTFDNVMFEGGPFGLRIASDAKDIYVALNDVYFVGPFDYAPFLFQETNSPIHITEWDNVRYATIVNGVLVPGALIPPPWAVEGGAPASAAPAVPTISSFSPDTGVAGDRITSANKLDVKGTADPNSTVTVYDNGTKIGTTTVNSTGSWDYITTVLTNAKHVLTATETNSSGTSAASAALTVTVDTHVPAAPVLTSDSIVKTNQVLLSGTAEANGSITVYDTDGKTVLGTTTAGANGAWSVTTSALSSGAHVLTATATDVAGTVSAASQPLDPVIPAAPTAPAAPTITSFSTDSGVVGDHITNDNTPTLSGMAVANSTIKVFDGTTQIATATADATGHWTTLPTSALSDGTHNLTATDTDSSGHTSASSTAFSITIDTHAPGAPTLAAYSQAGSAVGNTTALNDLVLKGTAEASSTIDVFDGGKQIGTAHTNSAGAWSYDTGNLANGTHSFTANAVDAAGNAGSASAVLKETVTAPTSPVPAPTASIEFKNVTEGWSNHFTIKGTADAYSQVKLYDGTVSLGTVTAGANGTWSFTTKSLSDTLHTVTAQELNSTGHVVATSSGEAVLAGSHTSTLTGTGGDDFLFSSSSQMNDTFVFASQFGHSTIQGFTVAGPGQDTIQFSKSVFDSFASVLSHASQVGQDVVIAAGTDTLTLKNIKIGALTSHDFHFG
jgi:hypothetical protein